MSITKAKYQMCCICGELTDCCEDDEFVIINSNGNRVAPVCETCFDIYNEIEGIYACN